MKPSSTVKTKLKSSAAKLDAKSAPESTCSSETGSVNSSDSDSKTLTVMHLDHFLDCPIHHCQPVRKEMKTALWHGDVCYCPQCHEHYMGMSLNQRVQGATPYNHAVWKLAAGSESASDYAKFGWNILVLDLSPKDIMLAAVQGYGAEVQ